MPADPETIIKDEVESVLALQRDLEHTEADLSKNAQFRHFLALQKKFNEVSTTIWDHVEKQMIEADLKTIKADWGNLTIAERLSWDFDTSLLPAKFFKMVVDTKKLSDTFRLEGKEPKGATAKFSKYLVRRLK